MKGILFNLKELMEREVFKNAKLIKYVDFDKKELITEKPLVVAPVLFFEELENNTLYVQLWVHKSMPEGWKVRAGALTAPKGFCWIYNGKSSFDEKYKKALLREH